jgi:putative ABC transport system permease protein
MVALTALGCSLAPALRASRPDLTTDLKQECGEPTGPSRTMGWWRHTLLGSQVLISTVLLLAAGLLVRGLYQAETLNPGFQTRDIGVAAYDLNGAGYDGTAAATFQQRLSERVSALPGVTVALARITPLSGARLGDRFSVSDGSAYFGDWNAVSPSFFSILGIPIVRGRGFTPADARANAGVVIVTESTARRFWPDANPIGQTIRREGGYAKGELDEVIGVARDAQVSRLSESDATYLYFPTSPREVSTLELLARRAGSVGDLTNDLRAAIRVVDPQLVASVNALDDNLELWRGLSRVAALAAIVLAGLALTLAAIGAYGVVAYSVSRRTREIGIRVALGATRREITVLVLRQTMRPVLAGALAGMICGAAVSRVLSSLLYGVSPYDPVAFLAVPLVLLTISGVASYVPARRGTRVDPLVALRYE